MSRFGPSRGEWWFRLGFSLIGLVLLGVALAVHGLPRGPALVEVVGVAGLFFGGTALWSAWRLWKG